LAKTKIATLIARGAIIAALYAVVTLVPPLNAISYSQIQFRISEALTVLAYFEPAAIPGLYIGVMIANLGSPFGLIDILGGSLLTLIAAYLTWKIKTPVLALLPPVIINAFGVALILKLAAGIPYWASVLWVGIGEVTVIYLLGYPLLIFILKSKILIREEAMENKLS
jgi:uncharacterized membrane protein